VQFFTELNKIQMKFSFAAIICLLSFATYAESPVTLTIDTQSPGQPVPRDFVGVSIFTGTQVKDHKGVPGNLFPAQTFSSSLSLKTPVCITSASGRPALPAAARKTSNTPI